MSVEFKVLENLFTVHRFPQDHEIPKQTYESDFYSISKTENELSIVCNASIQLYSERSETGWSCISVLGTLDFCLTGILADISAVLAKAEVSIFAISTFDTDYILVKSDNLSVASEALQKAGYTVK